MPSFGRPILGPERIARHLTRLGPTFVKVGQFLALRPDLVPQAYCDALLELTDAVPPEPWPAIRGILLAELGPLEERFRSVESEPSGAASLAQVHKAITHDGHEVALKVLRPGVRGRVERDQRRLARVLAVLSRAGVIQDDPKPVLEEVNDWLEQELDLVHELRNIALMYTSYGALTSMRIPRPLPEHSTEGVVASEFLAGTSFTTLMRESQPDQGTEGPAAALGARLLEVILHQIFRGGLFHADIHPGNLIALPGSVVGFVDFGLVSELDPLLRRRLGRYLGAVYAEDVGAMEDALLDVLIPTRDSNLQNFRADFRSVTRTWLSSGEGGDSGRGARIADYLVSVLRLARENQYRVPIRLLSMYRTLLTGQTIAERLSSAEDLGTVGRQFFVDASADQFFEDIMPASVSTAALRWAELVREVPMDLRTIISDAANQRLRVHVTVDDSPVERAVNNRRVRLLAAALISVGVANLLWLATGFDEPGRGWFVAVVGGALVVLYVAIAVMWRRLS